MFLLLAATILTAQTAVDPGAHLRALIEEEWEHRARVDPLKASDAGDRRYQDRLPPFGPADLEQRAAFERGILKKLREAKVDGVSVSDQISRRMLIRELSDRLTDHDFRSKRLAVNADWGFHLTISQLPDDTPFVTTKDYTDYTARLRAIPLYFDQQNGWMREGMRTGFTQPRVVMEGYEATMLGQVTGDPEQSGFFKPFRSFPAGVPEGERAKLRAEGRAAVAEAVIPAYRKLAKFFVDEYRPACRATIGASELPQGRAYYQHLVKKYTTQDVTPDAVHEIGLREVARIDKEMREVMAKTGFKGDFAAFIEMLRTDPRFYPKTAEELLKEASFIAKKIDGKLPAFFGKLPRLPYGVAAVPEAIAPKFTAGRYNDPPADGTRAGFYWVNTYDLKSRTLYTLEALTLHEAVPGHHLQNALSFELTDLPRFRRVSSVDAFGEGWGLYSEKLGLEAGFYTNPYSDFGRLTYEMWRACRLVVDTGLHWKGWTREQALDYMGSHTALSRREVQTEIDRYISWPGQALAYKMGELKILELRTKAEKALGSKFDRRSFHDAILAHGSVPLDVLEERIDAYIKDVLAWREGDL